MALSFEIYDAEEYEISCLGLRYAELVVVIHVCSTKSSIGTQGDRVYAVFV